MARWKDDAEGRLIAAAITLFGQRGYDVVTVAEIAEAAGLTKRTFFRYFADKREVLFQGSAELQECWLGGIAAAAPDACALAAATSGLDAVVELFADRYDLASVRAPIVASHPELQERELMKLQRLSEAVAAALEERGASPVTATLAAQTSLTVFHVAFARWVAGDDPAAFGPLVAETLAELRDVASA